MADVIQKPERIVQLTINGMPYVVVPNDYKVQACRETMDKPVREEASTFRLTDNDSFVKFLTVHATPRAGVYLSTDWPKNTEAIASACCDDGDKETTSWRDKRVTRVCSFTRDFRDWQVADRTPMKQIDFARFIERHSHNIFVPDDIERPVKAAELLTFVTKLSDIRKVTFKKSVNLDNGRIELNYQEEDEPLSGKVEMPKKFFIKLQPVQAYPALYCFEVALRYNIDDGTKLSFTLELRGLDLVYDAIRRDITDDIAAKIAEAVKAGELPDIPVYYCE